SLLTSAATGMNFRRQATCQVARSAVIADSLSLLFPQQIERVELRWRIRVRGVVRRRGLLAGEQVADAFQQAAGFVAHIDAELFGDADAGFEQQAAEREFVQVGFGVAERS